MPKIGLRNVSTIKQTCGACPEQYEGKLDTGEDFYVRCRWGHGRLDVNDVTVAEIDYENEYQGMFNDGDLVKLFAKAGIVIPPNAWV